MIRENAVDAVGGTPLVRLGRLHPAGNLAAKVEYMNPAGSVKERIAVNMIDRAEQQGLLAPGGTIVEPTSGNTGAGLAMVGAVRGYRVICTVPDKISPEKGALSDHRSGNLGADRRGGGCVRGRGGHRRCHHRGGSLPAGAQTGGGNGGGGGDPEGSIFCGGSRSAMFIRRTGKEYDNDR